MLKVTQLSGFGSKEASAALPVIFQSNYEVDASDEKGNAVILTGDTNVTGGKLVLDGVGDYLTCSAIGTKVGSDGDFTFEMFMDADSFNGAGPNGSAVASILETRLGADANHGFVLYRINSSINLNTSGADIISAAIPVHNPADKIHLAVVMEVTAPSVRTVSLYWQGTRIGVTSGEIFLGGTKILSDGFALAYTRSSAAFYGWSDFYAVRFTNSALYNGAAFVPPTDPFPTL